MWVVRRYYRKFFLLLAGVMFVVSFAIALTNPDEPSEADQWCDNHFTSVNTYAQAYGVNYGQACSAVYYIKN